MRNKPSKLFILMNNKDEPFRVGGKVRTTHRAVRLSRPRSCMLNVRNCGQWCVLA